MCRIVHVLVHGNDFKLSEKKMALHYPKHSVDINEIKTKIIKEAELFDSATNFNERGPQVPVPSYLSNLIPNANS